MTRTRGLRLGRFARLARLAVALVGLAALVLGVSNAAAQSAQASAASAVLSAATTPHDPITGAGSSWAGPAFTAWTANVKANFNWSVTYSASSSTDGRSQFCQGTKAFAATDIPYALKNSNESDSCAQREYVYMPVVAGGTAFEYNLMVAGKRVNNLRLAGETVAKIFTGVITKWNDPEIQAENPQIALPSIPIIPVVRSDGAGSTAQLTTWMRQMFPDVWDAYCAKVGRKDVNGHCGVTSFYPLLSGSHMIAESSDNSLVSYTQSAVAVGAINYVEYAYPLANQFPVAKLLNQAGYYTEPTPGHVAVSLLLAQQDTDTTSPTYLVEDLSQVYTNPDPRSYELSSYSYELIPTKLQANLTTTQGNTLADFSAYLLCQGQQQVDQLGYSALPINLVQAGQTQILNIPRDDPQDTPVIRSIAQCSNPTFSPDGTNKLADTDPQPPACDKTGPVQCLAGTGGDVTVATPTRNAAAVSGGAGGSGSSGGTTGSAGSSDSSGTAGGAASAGDPTTAADDPNAAAPQGFVNAAAKPVVADATPQSIPMIPVASRVLMWFIGIAGAVAIIALTAVPALVRRRRKSPLPPQFPGVPR